MKVLNLLYDREIFSGIGRGGEEKSLGSLSEYSLKRLRTSGLFLTFQDDDPGDCIYCAEEINVAIVECSQNDTTDVECAVDALAATSDCLACLCDSLNLVQGGDGECGGPVPTPTTAATTGAGAGTDDKELVLDCADCAADIADAVDACVAAAEGEATDIRCVELAIGATSQCVLCICDVVAVIGGVDQVRTRIVHHHVHQKTLRLIK